MKIGQQQSSQAHIQRLAWIGALCAVFLIGLFLGSRQDLGQLNKKIASYVRFPQPAATPQTLPTLVVDMEFEVYNELLKQRDEALETGVYIPSASDFVTATIQVNNSVVPVNMRFTAGPAAHLEENEKWGFEIRTRDDRMPLLGLQRCYLTDPQANNWLNQWGFARTLENEGLLTTRYQFVKVIFNGTDNGIYGLQEGFANELLAAGGRPAGVIVEFDADLLWKSLAHFEGGLDTAYADPVANLSAYDFQYFEVDTFRDATIARDPDLSTQKDTAIGLLRALQNGTISASQVFDVARYGRFLALADLWGAPEATSLVNLRYYYNPNSEKLEPIGFNANPLSTDARISLAATYHDPFIQAAYAQEAWRVSQPEYLAELQAALEPEFEQLREAVRTDYALAETPWDQLRERQERIRQSLDPVQPAFAYMGSPALTSDNIVRIDIANVINLPVEILGFDINGATFLSPDRAWLSDNADALLTPHTDRVILRTYDATTTPVIQYLQVDIPLTELHRLDSELDFMQEMEIQVHTRILGLDTTYQTRAQEGYPDIFIPGSDQ